jgi:hypothetical protein
MRTRQTLLLLSFLVPLLAFAVIVLYAICFPPASSHVGWPIIYGSILVGACLAASAQRSNWLRFAVGASYLAVAYVGLALTALFIACRVFGDCP